MMPVVFFFSDPRMDVNGAARLRMIVPPNASDSRFKNVANFNKAVSSLLNTTRLQNSLPALLEVITGKANKWGSDGRSGTIEPFEEIDNLVFSMTARMGTCHDLVENEADLKKIRESLSIMLGTATPTALILPWLPCPARVKVTAAGFRMALLLRKYIEARRHAEPTTDAIDILVAVGETTVDIVVFVAALFFAGIVNTGLVGSWTLVDLATHPEWREKCKKEIQDLLSRHFHDPASSATVYEKLISVHVSAWEDELPILDACIRESHRIALSGFLVRRNAGDDINIGGGVVKRGNFLVYHLGDVHLNPEYYPEPSKYDPGRWLQPDPVSKVVHPFLGWGAGRHPCSGMKVAKLEMKWIIAMFLMRYEYQLVDGDGKIPNPLPVPDRNASQIRPGGPPVYFKFKKVME